MANLWDADVVLSPEAAQHLVERQFPALAPASLVRLGQGWDNDAYLVNGRFVFRFPRREIAAELLRGEARLLPRMAAALPLPVPAPRFLGEPADGYPYPFAGYPFLAGRSADGVSLNDAERGALAKPLASFLRALHDLPVPDDAPPDLHARTELERRADVVKERLALLDADPAPGLSADDVLRRVVELSRTPPERSPSRLVHGDLYARHLLLDDDKRACGVIDWGDLHAGDPALDLAIAYSLLPAAARASFFASYGPVSDDMRARARFHALFDGSMLVPYGRSVGDRDLVRCGEVALTFALSEELA